MSKKERPPYLTYKDDLGSENHFGTFNLGTFLTAGDFFYSLVRRPGIYDCDRLCRRID